MGLQAIKTRNNNINNVIEFLEDFILFAKILSQYIKVKGTFNLIPPFIYKNIYQFCLLIN